MTREERTQLLADLRAAGVREYLADGTTVRIEFFRPPPPAPSLPAPEPVTVGPVPGQPHADRLVDAGGGVMVDPDLFAGELG